MVTFVTADWNVNVLIAEKPYEILSTMMNTVIVTIDTTRKPRAGEKDGRGELIE